MDTKFLLSWGGSPTPQEDGPHGHKVYQEQQARSSMRMQSAQIIKLNGYRCTVFYFIGRLQQAANDPFGVAAQHFSRATIADPKCVSAWINFGELFLTFLFTSAYIHVPCPVPFCPCFCYFALPTPGIAAVLFGDYFTAENVLSQALALDPTNGVAQLYMYAFTG